MWLLEIIIFGETELKDFADCAFDSSGSYWKVNDKGDLIDDENVSQVKDIDGRVIYSGSKGRQGTLQEWLGLANAFTALMQPAGYEWSGTEKKWTKNPGKITHSVIEQAHKDGKLTDDQYNLIECAAGLVAAKDEKNKNLSLFEQVMSDIQKTNQVNTQIRVDMVNRAWEWIKKKWSYNKTIEAKIKQKENKFKVATSNTSTTISKEIFYLNKSSTVDENLYYKQPDGFVEKFAPQTMSQFIQDEQGSKCNLFLEFVTKNLSSEIAKKILPNGIKSASALHQEFKTNSNLKTLNPESHLNPNRIEDQLLISAKEAAQKANEMANAGYLVLAASPKYDKYSAHVSFIIAQDNRYDFDYNPNLDFQKIYQGTTGLEKHQKSKVTVLWDYPVFLQAGNNTGIVPPGSAFSRPLFNNDKVDYYVVKR